MSEKVRETSQSAANEADPAAATEKVWSLIKDIHIAMLTTADTSGALYSRPMATLLVHPNDHPHDSDLVEADAEGWISAIHPKPRPQNCYLPNIVNAGVAVIEREILSLIRSGQHLDLAKDIFPLLVRDRRLKVYRSAEYFKDFGTPDRLARVRYDFETGKTARLGRGRRRPAVFLDRDGVINKEVSHLSDPVQMELIPGAAKAIRRLNSEGLLVIVVTNQPVVARGECTVGGLRLIHNKMETLLGLQGAWIDALYFCPHHPDKGFAGEVPELKLDCACRKPKIGMYEQAVRELDRFAWVSKPAICREVWKHFEP